MYTVTGLSIAEKEVFKMIVNLRLIVAILALLLCALIANKSEKLPGSINIQKSKSVTKVNPNFKNRGAVELTSRRVASGLTRPVFVCSPPGDTERLFIVEQRSGSTGRIKILDLNSETVLPTPFLQISGVNTSSEQGLLGLAFHPNYNENGFFYVNYTKNNDTFIERYTVSSNPNIADSSSGYVIWSADQPYSNHNSGPIQFNPIDGYLYFTTGDGGSGGDPGNRSQDITNQPMGKLFRLDVDSASPYAIPQDNPFVGTTGDDEIFAYGLRNPWQFDFDIDGTLYLGDVGQNAYEEINVVPYAELSGANFGWKCYEADHVYSNNGCPPASSLTFPAVEVAQGGSPYKCSITGGTVYRGNQIPSLTGTYFFGDYCSEQIWSFTWDGSNVVDYQERTSELDPEVGSIDSPVCFGRDGNGEVYICDLGGEIFKIESVGEPETVYVGDGQIYTTISDAISNQSSGDTILVNPGTYNERINFSGKSLILKSLDGPDSTIINGQGTGSVITITSDETTLTTIDGFTITGGSGTIGGGIRTSESPLIKNCVLTNNSATYGSAISNSFNTPGSRIENTLICSNFGGDQIFGPYSDNGGNSIVESCPTNCVADLSGDGSVNTVDLLALVSAFGEGSGSLGDLNQDGIVNTIDLLDLIGAFGPCE